MASSGLSKLACVALLCMVAAASVAEAAVTCGQVSSALAACKCLKSASGSISGINFGVVAAIPGKCGVNIPYKISPSTNCNSVK
ncbi:hypothetical protein EUGRSUZ_K01283 [Eucalyptus grandis]|uniref:Uncharacterized protein n=2 Tax=Eucalyptus grandis TaxID=71139 RepID=A0ACC3IU82_EUCGR|nr:hypothetical protein EUGRSUZ_K01283 [Eucalyptus grandis]